LCAARESCFRITDGRHRALAAMIAGRGDVLCVEDPPDPS
jgi:hypothetical protein